MDMRVISWIRVVTLVEHKVRLVLDGELADRTAESLCWRAVRLIGRPAGRFETITADNGRSSTATYSSANRRFF